MGATIGVSIQKQQRTIEDLRARLDRLEAMLSERP